MIKFLTLKYPPISNKPIQLNKPFVQLNKNLNNQLKICLVLRNKTINEIKKFHQNKANMARIIQA
jgi:hypothetical protein